MDSTQTDRWRQQLHGPTQVDAESPAAKRRRSHIGMAWALGAGLNWLPRIIAIFVVWPFLGQYGVPALLSWGGLLLLVLVGSVPLASVAWVLATASFGWTGWAVWGFALVGLLLDGLVWFGRQAVAMYIEEKS